MRRTASEVLRSLEMRVERLERKASFTRRASKGYDLLTKAMLQEGYVKDRNEAEEVINDAMENLWQNWHDDGQSEYAYAHEKEIKAGVLAKKYKDNRIENKNWQGKYLDYHISSMNDALDWAEMYCGV